MFLRDELSQGEYDEMKEEFLDQMKEFGETLDRLNKGDLTVTNKISVIKNVSRHYRHYLLIINFKNQYFFHRISARQSHHLSTQWK